MGVRLNSDIENLMETANILFILSWYLILKRSSSSIKEAKIIYKQARQYLPN